MDKAADPEQPGKPTGPHPPVTSAAEQVTDASDVYLETGETPLNRGFRLAKFEVFNWGTFDGAVHSFEPRGATSLLVGENGAGKSTLVDAMLTLLVRPGVRNYNVAAGGGKKERDEKSYIRGAYDRTAGGDGKPEVQILRTGLGYYRRCLRYSRINLAGGRLPSVKFCI